MSSKTLLSSVFNGKHLNGVQVEVISGHLSKKKYFNLRRGKSFIPACQHALTRSAQARSPLAKKHSATSQS